MRTGYVCIANTEAKSTQDKENDDVNQNENDR